MNWEEDVEVGGCARLRGWHDRVAVLGRKLEQTFEAQDEPGPTAEDERQAVGSERGGEGVEFVAEERVHSTGGRRRARSGAAIWRSRSPPCMRSR